MRLSRFIPLAAALTTLLIAQNTQPQGSLSPPGAPAPTFKTLEQIEPRTPITNIPFIISQPGSYYVTTNLTGNPGGITIQAGGVTLDLMGFELVGGTGDGVAVAGAQANVAIHNGTVRGWSGAGVAASDASNGLYRNLRLSANGGGGLYCGPNSTLVNCAASGNNGSGIATGDGSTISACSAVTNTVHGIAAGNGNTVNGCAARVNLQDGFNVGFGSTVKDCSALSNGDDGFDTAFDCTVTGCTARRNEFNGISANTGNTISDCTVAFNGQHGIVVQSDAFVRRNNCRQNGRTLTGAGIIASGASTGDNRIEENNVTGNDIGISCGSGGNIVIRNTATANTTVNYDIATGNAVGVIVAAPASGTISGSTGGAGVGTTDPWANFSY